MTFLAVAFLFMWIIFCTISGWQSWNISFAMFGGAFLIIAFVCSHQNIMRVINYISIVRRQWRSINELSSIQCQFSGFCIIAFVVSLFTLGFDNWTWFSPFLVLGGCFFVCSVSGIVTDLNLIQREHSDNDYGARYRKKNSAEVNKYNNTPLQRQTVPNNNLEGKKNAKVDTKIETNLTNIININSATEDELQELPGINKVKAKKIVRYIAANGCFNSVEEFFTKMQIKRHFAEQIRPYICANQVQKFKPAPEQGTALAQNSEHVERVDLNLDTIQDLGDFREVDFD